MKRQKRIAVINDFSGFGRCSLTVSLPIISAMKIQCCALPTAVLSNHTGYESYFFDDYTDKMKLYSREWEKLGLRFDGIYTGFLGSVRQVDLISDFIKRFADENTAVVVDPVMGDNGTRYATIDHSLCSELKKLLPLSSVITPNLTEACLLTDIPFGGGGFEEKKLAAISERLKELGAKDIVITGIQDGKYLCNYVSCANGSSEIVRHPLSGSHHAGTGDVFASVIAADRVNGVELTVSVKKASDFVSRAISLSDKINIPAQDGVCFEELLGELIPAAE